MAASQFLDFIRSVRNHYFDFASDGVLEDFVIFKELQKANGPPRQYKGTIGGRGGIFGNVGGNQVVWDVMFAELPFGEWGPATRIAPKTPQILKQASIDLGGYHVAYFISDFETASMNTKEQFLPLTKLYDQMSERRWYSGFEKSILANSTTGWQGLPAFMATTGTYASGIDLSADYGKPAKFDYSGSGQSFSVTGMDRWTQVTNEANHGDSQTAGTNRWTAFMRRTEWQALKSLIEDTRHVVDTDMDMVKLGFNNFMYNGVRAYWSDRMDEDAIKKVYFLNFNYIALAHATGKLFWQKTAETLHGIPGLLAVGFHKGQIVCTNTRCQAFLDNVDQS
jgi:hypothetical protein